MGLERAVNAPVFYVVVGLCKTRVNDLPLRRGVVRVGRGKSRPIHHHLRGKDDFSLMETHFHQVSLSDASPCTEPRWDCLGAFLLYFNESCAHGDAICTSREAEDPDHLNRAYQMMMSSQLSFQPFPVAVADHRLRIHDLPGPDARLDLSACEPTHLDPLVLHRRCF